MRSSCSYSSTIFSPACIEELRIKIILLLGRYIFKRMFWEKKDLGFYFAEIENELLKNEVPHRTIQQILNGVEHFVLSSMNENMQPTILNESYKNGIDYRSIINDAKHLALTIDHFERQER